MRGKKENQNKRTSTVPDFRQPPQTNMTTNLSPVDALLPHVLATADENDAETVTRSIHAFHDTTVTHLGPVASFMTNDSRCRCVSVSDTGVKTPITSVDSFSTGQLFVEVNKGFTALDVIETAIKRVEATLKTLTSDFVDGLSQETTKDTGPDPWARLCLVHPEVALQDVPQVAPQVAPETPLNTPCTQMTTLGVKVDTVCPDDF